VACETKKQNSAVVVAWILVVLFPGWALTPKPYLTFPVLFDLERVPSFLADFVHEPVCFDFAGVLAWTFK